MPRVRDHFIGAPIERFKPIPGQERPDSTHPPDERLESLPRATDHRAVAKLAHGRGSVAGSDLELVSSGA